MNEKNRIFWKFVSILVLGTCFLTLGIAWLYYMTIVVVLPMGTVNEHLRNFWVALVCIELFFVLLISMVFMQLLERYSKHQKAVTDFFELIIEIISHKLGNFLAGQKVNIALLDSEDGSPVVDRINNAILVMEGELKELSKALDSVKEKALFLDQYEDDLLQFIHRERQKHKRLSGLSNEDEKTVKICNHGFKLNSMECAFLLSLIVENAFKYCHKRVKIRAGSLKNADYFFISNDISKKRTSGLGIGLSIASHICRKNNFRLRLKNTKNNFMAFVVFPRHTNVLIYRK